jgi:hypothetical protein
MSSQDTSELLVKYCYNDELPTNPAVICDFFDGYENINLILGVYQGLVKYKGVNANELHKALKSNKLNELIHQKYKYHKSGLYNKFCELNIKVGTPLELNDKYEVLDNDILNYNPIDDDHCPNCNQSNYYKQNNLLGEIPDCNKCFNIVCKLCSKYDNKKYSRTCLKCISFDKTKKLLQNIKDKISNHNKYDKNRFGKIGNVSLDDIKELLNKQQFKCYICNDEVKTTNWTSFCCYQFSIDRIDDNKPHDRNNILISCYYCNCRQYPDFNQHNKLCKEKCHIDKKENIPLKNSINKSIIDKFRLN